MSSSTLHQAAQKAVSKELLLELHRASHLSDYALSALLMRLESALQQQPEPVALPMTDAEADAIHSMPWARDCLLRYVDRPCDKEARDAVRAIVNAASGLMVGTAPPALQHQEVPREPVALERWGRTKRNGSVSLERMADGYWTPWHIAQEALAASPSTTRQQEVGSGLLDNETFRKGIREDGTVEGYYVETYYLPCKAIGDDDGFLRVVVDDNATDAETRVPHSALISAGWVRAAAPSTPENAGGGKEVPKC